MYGDAYISRQQQATSGSRAKATMACSISAAPTTGMTTGLIPKWDAVFSEILNLSRAGPNS
jgi:hypothetical protein